MTQCQLRKHFKSPAMPHPAKTVPHSPRYRADVDGLRAVAVLPVVLYHYGIPGFGGGFVGVDVFFVISGFLITSLIHAEMIDGRFSIVSFYERRVRRILPALIALIAICFLVSLVVLFPTDLKRFASSVIGASLFGSNFAFWLQAGYFESGADLKPLLHTWSLGVEEQFYMLFPAVLWLLRGVRKSLLVVIIAILSILSLTYSVWGVVHAPTTTFFLLPARSWELGLGALLALGALPGVTNRALGSALALAGLALIGWSVATLTAETPFPGLAAIAPCVGAALVIYAGMATTTPVAAVLSLRPVVFVGLLSYSLYLWHWPIYVFGKYGHFDGINWPLKALLIALSFAAAWVSLRFIETPIRKRQILAGRRSLFVAAASAMAVFIGASAVVLFANGLPQRYAPDVRQLLAGDDDYDPNRANCLSPSLDRVSSGDLCTMGVRRAGGPDFVVWGDSHGEALRLSLDEIARKHNRYGVLAAWSSCPPVVGVRVQGRFPIYCDADAEAALRLIAAPSVKTVFLIGRWAVYAEGKLSRPEKRDDVLLSDGKTPEARANNPVILARAFEVTLARLRAMKKRIVVVGPVPEADYVVPDALAQLAASHLDHEIAAPTRAQFALRQRYVLPMLARAQATAGVTVLYPHTLLCDAQHCAIEADGRALYSDNNHISTFGAKHIAALFEPAL